MSADELLVKHATKVAIEAQQTYINMYTQITLELSLTESKQLASITILHMNGSNIHKPTLWI